MGGRRLAKSFSRSAAAERLVNAMLVVIISELFQLSPQTQNEAIERIQVWRPPAHAAADDQLVL